MYQSETMCKVSKCNVPCIIAGDININLLNCSTDKHTDEYMKNMLLHGFVPVIVMPTRITSRSALTIFIIIMVIITNII